MRRLLSAAAAVTMLVAIHPSPAAALFIRPTNQLTFSVPITGTANPYTLYLRANDVGSGAHDYLDVWFGRTAAGGNKPQQTHIYNISGVTVACSGPALAQCEIDSGSQLGSLGTIHLFYTSTGQPATVHHACPTEYGSTYDETRHGGHVTGTFMLNTGTTYFKTIQNDPSKPVHIPSSIATRASRFTYGTNCSSTGPCTSDLFVGTSPSVGSVSSYQYPGSGVGSFELDSYGAPVASTTVRHQVFGQAHVTVLHVTSGTPQPLQKISVSMPFQPFISGNGTFTGSGSATVSNFPGCHEVDRSGSFSGSFTAHFDGWGTKTFNGTNPATAQRLTAQP